MRLLALEAVDAMASHVAMHGLRGAWPGGIDVFCDSEWAKLLRMQLAAPFGDAHDPPAPVEYGALDDRTIVMVPKFRTEGWS